MSFLLKILLLKLLIFLNIENPLKARQCEGKVIGGPLSGKENVKVSKILNENQIEIISLLNFDLKKASADDVQKKWFLNYEKLNFNFPKVNLVKVYFTSGDGAWYGNVGRYLIPDPDENDKYIQISNNGSYGGSFGLWPFLASDNKIYKVGFEPYMWGTHGKTKCIFLERHNTVLLSPKGRRYFAYEFDTDTSIYMWPENAQYGDQRKITGHALLFRYYPVELKSIDVIPGFEFK